MTEQPFVSSRFPLREKPTAYPHYDLILQDSQGPVFDLNVEMDAYNGSVYIRTDHIIEMGRTLGMATAEEVQKLRDIISDLRRQVNKLPLAQEELKSGIDDLVSQFYVTINTTTDADDVSVPDVPQTESDDEPDSEPERKTSGPIVF